MAKCSLTECHCICGNGNTTNSGKIFDYFADAALPPTPNASMPLPPAAEKKLNTPVKSTTVLPSNPPASEVKATKITMTKKTTVLTNIKPNGDNKPTETTKPGVAPTAKPAITVSAKPVVAPAAFGGMKKGFLSSSSNEKVTKAAPEVVKTESTTEKKGCAVLPVPLGPVVVADNSKEDVKDKENAQKLKKEEKTVEKTVDPVPEIVDRPVVEQVVEVEKAPVKRCNFCPAPIQPGEEGFFKMTCLSKCDLYLHKHCFQTEKLARGYKSKKDMKTAICFTDGCMAEVKEIHEVELNEDLKLFLKCDCAHRETVPVTSAKEKKKEKRKEKEQHKNHHKDDRKASATEDVHPVEEDEAAVVEEVPQFVQQPTTSVRRAVPLTVEMSDFARPLERKDEFAEKYGLAKDKEKESTKKKRGKEKKVVNLNLVDENIQSGVNSHPKAKTWKSDDEDESLESGHGSGAGGDTGFGGNNRDTREKKRRTRGGKKHRKLSEFPEFPCVAGDDVTVLQTMQTVDQSPDRGTGEPFPSSSAAAFTGFGGFNEFTPVEEPVQCYSPRSKQFPKVDDGASLEWIVEELERYKDTILINLGNSGAISLLQDVMKFIIQTEMAGNCEPHLEHLDSIFSSSDLTRQFLQKLGWFVISLQSGQMMFKKRVSAPPVGTGPSLHEAESEMQSNLSNTVTPASFWGNSQAQPLRSIVEQQQTAAREEAERERRELSRLAEEQREQEGVNEAIEQIMNMEDSQLYEESANRQRSQSESTTCTTATGATGSSSDSSAFELLSSSASSVSASTNSEMNHLLYPPGINPAGASLTPRTTTPSTAEQEEIRRLRAELDRRPQMHELQMKEAELARVTAENRRLLEKVEQQTRCQIDKERELEMTSAQLQKERIEWISMRTSLEGRANDESTRVQYKSDELRRVQRDQAEKEEKEGIVKRKEVALAAVAHINQIVNCIQARIFDDDVPMEKQDEYSKMIEDLVKLREEWDNTYQMTTQRLCAIESGSTTDVTVIPPTPLLPQSCSPLYVEALTSGSVRPEERVTQVYSRVYDAVREQCRRYEKGPPSESTLRSMIVRFDLYATVMGNSDPIDVDKCVEYVCNELKVPLRKPASAGPAWKLPDPIGTKPAAAVVVAPPPQPATPQGPHRRHIDVANHECKICLEHFPVEEGVEWSHCPHPNCNEVYHKSCIISWLVTKMTGECPQCRGVWPDEENFPSL